MIAQVAAAGGSRVRVFGSVSTGGEHEGSDIDLLIRAAPGTGLLEISRLELRLSELLGTGVDVVPDDSIRPSMRRRILKLIQRASGRISRKRYYDGPLP